MKLGVVNEETWRFFGPIYAEFGQHHQTSIYQFRPIELPLFEARVNNYRSRTSLQRFLKSQDVVFFEWASEQLVRATRLEKSCAIVTRMHRYELYQWADQINWDRVDLIIVVSQAKKHEFSQRFPSHAPKVVVVPEAIDLSKFTFTSKTFSGDLGILCHLSPRKRVYELILAFSALLQENKRFHLHVGGGPHSSFPEYEKILKSLVARLDLEDKVTFYGPVQDAAGWYQNIDIFISNSYSEGLQVSPMEAMASGCYCLSHWWDGADELMSPEELFFTDGELIKGILQYSALSGGSQEDIRKRLHLRVQQQFNVEDTKKEIRQLVEKTTQNWINASR